MAFEDETVLDDRLNRPAMAERLKMSPDNRKLWLWFDKMPDKDVVKYQSLDSMSWSDINDRSQLLTECRYLLELMRGLVAENEEKFVPRGFAKQGADWTVFCREPGDKTKDFERPFEALRCRKRNLSDKWSFTCDFDLTPYGVKCEKDDDEFVLDTKDVWDKIGKLLDDDTKVEKKLDLEELVRQEYVRLYGDLGYRYEKRRFVEVGGYWFCVDPLGGVSREKDGDKDTQRFYLEYVATPKHEAENEMLVRQSSEQLAIIAGVLGKYGVKQEMVRGVWRNDNFIEVLLSDGNDLQGDEISGVSVWVDTLRDGVWADDSLDRFGIPTVFEGHFRLVVDFEPVEFSRGLEAADIDDVQMRMRYLVQEMEDASKRGLGEQINSLMHKGWERLLEQGVTRQGVEDLVTAVLEKMLSMEKVEGVVDENFLGVVNGLKKAGDLIPESRKTFCDKVWPNIEEATMMNGVLVMCPRDLVVLPILYLGIQYMAEKSSMGDSEKKKKHVAELWGNVKIVWADDGITDDDKGRVLVTNDVLDTRKAKAEVADDLREVCKRLGKKTMVLDIGRYLPYLAENGALMEMGPKEWDD